MGLGGEHLKKTLKDTNFILPMTNVTILDAFGTHAQRNYGKVFGNEEYSYMPYRYNFFPYYDVSLKTISSSSKSVEPDEMQLMLHFIRVYTVCQSTGLGASGMQRAKLYERVIIEHFVDTTQSSAEMWQFMSISVKSKIGSRSPEPNPIFFRLHPGKSG